MSVRVEFLGRLSVRYGASKVMTGESIASLRAQLDLNDPTVRAVVNDVIVADTQAIASGDRVAFLPPVGGG